jgi:hypothetical protein
VVLVRFWKVVFDEGAIGRDGVHCGDNDAQLGRVSEITGPRTGSEFAARCSSTSSAA